MEQNDLRNIIEKGIEKLEEIADVKWPTAWNAKMTREKLIAALEINYIENIQLWKILGYIDINSFPRAMRKVATNIKNRPKHIYWEKYILELSGHKQCSKCREIKSVDEFYNLQHGVGDKGYICISCETEYRKNNKEYSSKYREEHKEEARKYNKKYREENDKRMETTLHIINVMIRESKLPECELCGYKENWTALEFHHVDLEIERPEWSYDKNGKKLSPSNYILAMGKNTAEKRYLYEIDNLAILCRNCHQKEHFTARIDSQKGLKEALPLLGYDYKCNICDENEYLHLHHNNRDEKEYAFQDFQNKSMKRIIKDKLLENEINKDVSILCGNHHREIHNPKYKLEEMNYE